MTEAKDASFSCISQAQNGLESRLPTKQMCYLRPLGNCRPLNCDDVCNREWWVPIRTWIPRVGLFKGFLGKSFRKEPTEKNAVAEGRVTSELFPGPVNREIFREYRHLDWNLPENYSI